MPTAGLVTALRGKLESVRLDGVGSRERDVPDEAHADALEEA